MTRLYRNTVRIGANLSGTVPNLEGLTGEYWSAPVTRTTAALADGTMYMRPIYVVRDRAVDRIGASVTTSAASSTITLGIYEDDGTCHPGALLVDAGTIDGGSQTAQEKTIAVTLRGGKRYWLAGLVDAGTPTLRVDSASGTGFMGRNASLATALGSSGVMVGRTQTGIVGSALPNPAVAGATLNSAVITIALRLA